MNKFKDYFEKINSDSSERNRFLIIFLFILFLFDYLLFCYMTERNPLKILPALPILEDREAVNIFLPDIDGKTILNETREIAIPEDMEGYIKLLIEKIVNGSEIDNTSIAVPAEIFIRKIWLNKDMCIIDMVLSDINDTTNIIPGSEKIFIESIRKTIIENIPSIRKVILLEKGLPGKALWE